MTTEAFPTSDWVPACGGTETPFTTRTGRRLLDMWNLSTGEHAYNDIASDIFLSNDEASTALAMS